MKLWCTALEFSSKEGVVSPWVGRPGCLAHYLVGVPQSGWAFRA